MNTATVHAGRLERRVRRVGRKTMPGFHGFCSFYSSGAIRGVPLLRLTAFIYPYSSQTSLLPPHSVRPLYLLRSFQKYPFQK